MIAIKWAGKACSKNDMHNITRQGAYYNTKVYNSFLEDLAWSIKVQTQGIAYKRVNLTIATKLFQIEHQNLLDGICDAIQRSGIIANDKYIANIYMQEPERHSRGAPDEILILISEVKT